MQSRGEKATLGHDHMLRTNIFWQSGWLARWWVQMDDCGWVINQSYGLHAHCSQDMSADVPLTESTVWNKLIMHIYFQWAKNNSNATLFHFGELSLNLHLILIYLLQSEKLETIQKQSIKDQQRDFLKVCYKNCFLRNELQAILGLSEF